MFFPKARLVVSACLFLAWIGFLAYLVARTRNPVILARPQLNVSSVILLAEVSEKDGRPDPTVTVKKVSWAVAKDDVKLAGTQLNVEGLSDCGAAQGWSGPGLYILPLLKRESGAAFEVTPLPMSPGYWPAYATIELINPGPDKEKVVELLNAITSGTSGLHLDARPGILRRNASHQEAEQIEKQLKTAKAIVRITEGETRIYRATADAMEQLEELQPPR